jgi:MoaA/NifB/PqqE/SkfB family radical SAM enzyme
MKYNFNDAPHFCAVPFSHIYYFSDGYAYPCPMLAGKEKFRLGKNTDLIEDLWNSSVMKEMRLKMLNNKLIIECHNKCNININSCKKHLGEEAIERNLKQINSTASDGTLPLNFSIWNIMDSNRCNLACNYCNGDYSNRHLNGGLIRKSFTLDYNMLDIYKEHISSVEEVWFAGGEPVILESTYNLLELLKSKKESVRIRFITNLMFIEFRGIKVYELLKEFKDVIIFGSWDLDGTIGEYIRYGNKSETIIKNINYINSLGLKFVLQPVMSIFNIFNFSDFHKRMFDLGVLKKDNIRYYVLSGPDYFRFSILPSKVKDIVTENLNEYSRWLGVSENYDLFPNREQPSSYIKKMIILLNSGYGGHTGYSKENNFNRLKKFFTETNKQDIKKYGYFKFLSLYKKYEPEKWLNYDNY